ncbi:MAG: alpha-2-macroglobulin family protein [Planctomycetaceae bacterium]
MPMLSIAEPSAAAAMADEAADGGTEIGGEAEPPDAPPAGLDIGQVSPRKNLNETAFFFPHLISANDGTVRIEFTMPDALTEWKFFGFAHDKQLRAGLLSEKVVTAKDLMVQPNPPRFVREGDVIEFTTKVSNQSPTRLTGSVNLTLMDARTGEAVNERLQHIEQDLPFDIPPGESTSVSWKLSVPDGLGFVTYRVVGGTGKLSDGEEGFLPVLSRRMLVKESLPLPIRGPQTKEFDFSRLSRSGDSKTLKHQSLTVQMTSNPSWYAVLALPYLMEYPHECSEQVFNRLYANSLARKIAGSDPQIHRVFELWRGTPALDSPLEKSQDLKSVMLEETPWLREAESESQARRNVGVLFEDNRLDEETSRLLFKLQSMQLEDGAWPWFPGGRANDYITLYITTGFGRLRHLGVNLDTTAALKSLARLDQWMTKSYQDIAVDQRDKNQLSTTIALYLYARSFFLADQPVADVHQQAVQYWLKQAKEHWLALGNRQSQAHLALALKRFGDLPAAKSIMASLKERSIQDEELGAYWGDQQRSWWWYHAPIESQAMMIEAFDEVTNDSSMVDDCKVWLLKQKQTQDWGTTKATADAVYALLLRGSDMLASDAAVEIKLGGQTIDRENVEAGTGFYEQRFSGGEIKPELGQITVTKLDEGVAWGGIHWQYLEDIGQVTPYEGTPLQVSKQLYIKRTTKKGPELRPVEGAIEVGDELVTRIVLRSDRDMEYVHLKDYRGSGTEPVNVLSEYKYQDGLAYYESTRDTASHFFIDYLRKGTYVFEYSTRVQLRGRYQTGVASIECMYAPEFNSHSESVLLEVK